MSWGNYDQRPDRYRPVSGSGPYGRAYDSSEPSGYVTDDPHAVPGCKPGYNQSGVVLTVLMLVPALFLAIVSSASSYGSGFSSDLGVGLVLYVLFVMMISLGLVVLILSLQVRRLHDAGFSGSSALSPNIPYLNSIGWRVPFVMSYFPSRPEGVKYDNPNGSQPASI